MAAHRKPKPRVKREPTWAVGVPKSICLEIDHLIEAHPEFAIKDRNDFARRALALQLKELRHDIYVRAVVQAQGEKPGPLEHLRDSGLKL